jgi:hypothetical protein
MLNSEMRSARSASIFVRDSLPVIQRIVTKIPADEHRRLKILAENLVRDEPALTSTEFFGDRVVTGIADDRPAVVLADHSEISLYDRRGEMSLEYRMLLLAQRGDLAIIGAQRSADFEKYCREKLGLGRVEVLALPDTGNRAQSGPARRCRTNAAIMTTLAHTARLHDGLTILPYMGTGEVWMLAAEIAKRAGVTVHVAAPPPRLTRRVNDKIWFAARVREVLGPDALPPSFSTFGPAALAARVAYLARHNQQVVVKLPDSASGSGNLVLPADDLRGMPLSELRQTLINLLEGLGWHGTYPLLAGVWDAPVLANPSVQLWVPLGEDGPPIVEGLFDQRIEGPQARFVGASLSRLPVEWQERIAGEAARLAYLFQQLGYYGRCSLDVVLVGETLENASLHWIECNGRWGGTSLPMTIANRLLPEWGKGAALIVQRPLHFNATRRFADVAERLESKLLSIGHRDKGIVFLSPGGLEDGTGLNFLVFADTDAQADAYCQAVIEAVQ